MWHISRPFPLATIIPFPHPKRSPGLKIRDLHGLPKVLGRFGPFELRIATTKKEIRKAQRLRYKVFFEEGNAVPQRGAGLVRRDICRFDKICDHLLVFDMEARNSFGRVKPKIVGTYRMLRGDVAARHGGFYSQSEFDIAPLLARHKDKKFLELGRSCVHPKYRSKRVIELLFRGLTLYALHHKIDVVIGCASLSGTNPLALALPLSFLHHKASAEEEWQVRPLSGRAVPMGILESAALDGRRGLAALPPLLKAYVRAGCKFGDGAVIDKGFGTIDVFTILQVANFDERYLAHFSPSGDGKENVAA
jgi:L-ornithine Nalpha-acyltransferase